MGMSSLTKPGLPTLLALLLSACVGGSEGASNTERTEAPVVDGRVVTPFGPGVEPEYTKGILYMSGGCVGSLIKPSWVLSAGHCPNNVPGGTAISVRPNNTTVPRAIDAIVRYPQTEAVMLHLDAPYTDIPTVPFYAGSGVSVVNQTFSVYGYGPTNPTRPGGVPCDATHACPAPKACNKIGWCVQSPPFPVMTTADLTAELNASPFFVTVHPNSQGQKTIPGDSGGPAIIGGAVAAMVSYGDADLTYATFTNIATVRSRIQTPSRVQYAVADFNNDGKSDYIVTSPSGTTWLMWTSTGLNPVRTDASLTLGSVSFTIADFDGDHRSDFIQTTPGGSTIMYATATPGQFTQVASRTDWIFGDALFTVGQFDSSNVMPQADLVVSTGTGTSWYYNGSFAPGTTPVFTRTDLTSGNSALTPGDFDGDGRTDLIVSTKTGTQWLYADVTKTWNARSAANTRADLTIDSAEFTVGKFRGSIQSDMIITTSSGSYWYYGITHTRDRWNEAYVRGDLPLGTVKYTAGDLDGDGKDDLMITMAGGTWWYFSTGTGTWDDAGVRGDLTLGDVMFTVVRDDGPAGKDVIITTAAGSTWLLSNGRDFTYGRTTPDAL